jgi:serine/threonine protein kinase
MKIDESEKGLIFGTPQYTSPEVLTGEPIHMGSDIYALGVMAYQLLTGECPFKRDTIELTAKAHLYEELPRIETVRPDVTPELAKFIHGAIEKKPNKRIRNWEEVLALVEPPEHLLKARTCSHLVNLTYPESQKPAVEAALNQLAQSLRSVSELGWQEGSFDLSNRARNREPNGSESPFGAPLSWLYDKIGVSLSENTGNTEK